MKTTLYRGLYHVFLFLSNYFDNRFITTCKLLAASGLLACTAGCRQRPMPPRLPSTPLPESIARPEEEERSDSLSARADTAKEKEPQIFCYVKEIMPEFPGGEAELLRFIQAHKVYPEEARKLGLEGRIIVSMMIDTMGCATPDGVIRGVHPLLDSAALDVIRKMPRWKPGETLGGHRVAVRYTLPITFKLEKDSLPKKTKGI